jgi:hypothetical protein
MVEGLWLNVRAQGQRSGLRVKGLRFWVLGSGFHVSGLGFRI